MKNLLLGFIIFLSCPSSSEVGGASTTPVYSCRITDLNEGEERYVRTQPDPESDPLATLPPIGTIIQKLPDVAQYKHRAWFKIRYLEVTGWVNAAYLRCHLSPEEARAVIAERAEDVIEALSAFDIPRLASYVHPEKGVRLTPYAYVDPDHDLRFHAQDLVEASDSSRKYLWGEYDGTGFDIYLSLPAYNKEFIYAHDFAEAEQIAYNRFIGSGNTINNAWDVYPYAIIVEYHFPGFNPRYDGMDWASLRLVFEELEQQWYVVGLIHDGWTI